MAAYNPRRAPNVSQYLANLNALPSAQDLAAQNDLNLAADDEELAFLTNAQFFDFDEFHQSAADHDQTSAPPQPNNAAGAPFAFSEFQTFPSPPSALPAFPANTTGTKRKASFSLASPADLEETSRMAAEEDKRRRNTAASARFRVKKKQREQALEKQSKDMTDRVSQLEGKIQQLEMENKWLKELITEKSADPAARSGLEAGLEKRRAKVVEEVGRKPEKRSDGVGTGVEEEDEVEDDVKDEE